MFALSNLLFVFTFFVLLTVLFFIFNLFHIIKFGLQSTQTTIVLGAYTLGFFIVLGGTLLMLITIDWDQPVNANSVFDNFGLIEEV